MKLKYKKQIPIVRSFEDTLVYVLNNKCSISRFGDGEMDLICGLGNGFCSFNSKLANRLKEVLTSDLKGHIICIPYPIVSMEPFTKNSQNFWIGNLLKRLPQWVSLTQKDKVYYCAQISRFYIPFKDKTKCWDNMKRLKTLWTNQDVLIVEGMGTRMGVGNDLFDNVLSLQRILCPSENAFEKYDEILNVVKYYATDKLVLIALGQTATVLAYDLALEGYWAMDIGHIDLEYEWCRLGVSRPVNIENKYVNEIQAGRFYGDLDDECYKNQIITQIH